MIKRLLIVLGVGVGIGFSNKINAQIMITDSLNALKVGTNFNPTKYKKGFSYTTKRGEKVVLDKYIFCYAEFGVNVYRWRVKASFGSVNYEFWTDDCWIDVETGKAYLNEKLHKIVYY